MERIFLHRQDSMFTAFWNTQRWFWLSERWTKSKRNCYTHFILTTLRKISRRRQTNREKSVFLFLLKIKQKFSSDLKEKFRFSFQIYFWWNSFIEHDERQRTADFAVRLTGLFGFVASASSIERKSNVFNVFWWIDFSGWIQRTYSERGRSSHWGFPDSIDESTKRNDFRETEIRRKWWK